jgi:hypothetical protein
MAEKKFFSSLVDPARPRRTKILYALFLVLYFLLMVGAPLITISVVYGWWTTPKIEGAVGGPVIVTLVFMIVILLLLCTKKIKKVPENAYKRRRLKHIVLMAIYLILPGLIAWGAWYSRKAMDLFYDTLEWSMLWVALAIVLDHLVLSEYEYYFSIEDKVDEAETIDFVRSARNGK